MYSAFLLLGSNEGNRLQLLSEACTLVRQHAGMICRSSRIYETEAWGKEGLPPHLNQAINVETDLEPLELLTELQHIETVLGRERKEKWGIRKMDIDIIYFENFIIQRPQLQIPHPLMQLRRFVLVPLAEIAPEFRHPVLLKTNCELLDDLQDPLTVRPLHV
ncbi:MAG TPA: 2-amino-4-hydroxy-6-hydroxymethyldihydropteridine diphosphokinase [Edaphocola sp.]|nr:2-amino-4-hydroxy-6-hydroxymethyldihydropteridine diphosphokinase [Edaphocola sp.]